AVGTGSDLACLAQLPIHHARFEHSTQVVRIDRPVIQLEADVQRRQYTLVVPIKSLDCPIWVALRGAAVVREFPAPQQVVLAKISAGHVLAEVLELIDETESRRGGQDVSCSIGVSPDNGA